MNNIKKPLLLYGYDFFLPIGRDRDSIDTRKMVDGIASILSQEILTSRSFAERFCSDVLTNKKYHSTWLELNALMSLSRDALKVLEQIVCPNLIAARSATFYFFFIKKI